MARKLVHDGSHLSLEEREMIQKGIESRAPNRNLSSQVISFCSVWLACLFPLSVVVYHIWTLPSTSCPLFLSQNR